MARDCAIGCPVKVRKSFSYLYPSFLGLDVVLRGSDLYLKPRRVRVRKQHRFPSGNPCWVPPSSGVTCGVLRSLLVLVLPSPAPVHVIPLTLGGIFVTQLQWGLKAD